MVVRTTPWLSGLLVGCALQKLARKAASDVAASPLKSTPSWLPGIAKMGAL